MRGCCKSRYGGWLSRIPYNKAGEAAYDLGARDSDSSRVKVVFKLCIVPRTVNRQFIWPFDKSIVSARGKGSI